MSGTLRLRVRGPQGVATLSVDKSATWREFKQSISSGTGVTTDFDLKYGYPPQPLDTESINNDTRLIDLPYKLDGEQLIVMPRAVQNPSSSPLANNRPPAPSNAQILPPRSQISPPTHQSGDFPSAPLNLTRHVRADLESDPPEIPVPELGGVMVLRVMPDDNSCMFRALSSATMGSELDGMTELRSIVAQQISAKPDFWTAGVLEKEPAAYCRWIQREDSWGGGIELSILSEYFDIEICSINVQDVRVDRFNEGRERRCILVFSGIHYDVCAVTPYPGVVAPDADKKVFDVLRVGDEELDGGALAAARELCKVLQQRHYFTDTHGFTVKCNSCGQNGTGERWAVQHAQSTGHSDFGEG